MSVTFTIDTHPSVTVPQRVITSLSAFREWAGNNDLPENVKVFFYRGEVWIDMGKQQIFTHVAVKTEITRVLAGITKTEKLGMYLVDGVLLTNEAADLSGNPDMVLEVVSDSSEKKDNQTLFEAYYEAGILEYWLVDARGDEIEFHIYKRGSKRYSAIKQQNGWVKSAAFGKSFRLIRGMDATGNPEFTLEMK